MNTLFRREVEDSLHKQDYETVQEGQTSDSSEFSQQEEQLDQVEG